MAINTHTTVNLSEVLYENVLAGKAYTYSGTEVSGFEVPQMFDWRDFTFFSTETNGNFVAEFTMTSETKFDTLSFFYPAGQYGSDNIQVEYESSPGVFVNVGGISLQQNRQLAWVNFSQEYTVASGLRIRLLFNVFVGFNTRSLALGKRLQFAQGQWSGINPPELNQGIVNGNTMAVNGSFLGRNRRRFEKKGQIKLEHLSQTWVRDSWNPFSIEAAKHAFFYRWNPAEYPFEVSYAVGEIRPPENTTAGNMKVEMPIMFLTE